MVEEQPPGSNDHPQVHNSELEAKLFDAFDLFDHERNKTIDFRELGTVIRSIGGVPTEAELMQLVRELENDPPNGYINFEKFLPAMLEAFEQNRFRGASEQELIKAFSILDADHKGYLSVEEIEAHMTTEGEPFSTDEMEEMLASATDVTRGKVIYREYVVLLTTYDEESL
ncbi:unnamed protein product [Calicophoron daubneyi]|uniref:EF-hand domain-containing protein n=1 Tax=Calicophoron daubneyi TaxID=300641 RepID=A0AAV2TG41_CALDB